MDDLAQPLAELLGAAHVTGVTRLSGGASRDTFRISGHVPQGERAFVVVEDL